MVAATAPSGPVRTPIRKVGVAENGIRLGGVQESPLIPLYGRAAENRGERAALRDARAEEIVASIDHVFARFGNCPA